MSTRSALSWIAGATFVVLLGGGCDGSKAKSSADAGGDKDASMSASTDAATSNTDGGGGTSGAADAGGKAGTGGGGTGGGSGGTGATGTCPAPAPNQPPDSLSCTGLYNDIAAKTLASEVHEFMPAVPLWSDGAEKTRWISLPAGQKIDVSNLDAWKFPVGTKFFKEFKSGGKRIETRMFWKLTDFYWARTAYKWNAGETEATRTGGEDVQVGSSTYHIPSTTECDQCHKGRQDRALGFETILLGLPGATGMNLAMLKSQGLTTGGTLPGNVTLGDDGSGKGAEALAWLHVNCGVSCHNGNSASEAYSTGLKLRLLAADADGRALTGVDTLTTTLGVATTTGRWLGKKRIVAGQPSMSWLYTLMSTRNPGNMKDQMPPIASRVVPTEGAKLINDWIIGLGGGGSAPDAGM